MTNNTQLAFNSIPGFSRLFIDYLYDNKQVESFYPQSQHSLAAIQQHAAPVLAQHYQRQALVEVLTKQNQEFGSSPLTFEHLTLLAQSNTVAVVTGQQAGLFTGPLYTIYKALTAIKIAAWLRSQGQPAVPVFWVASEDHDFAEVNHLYVVNKEGQRVRCEYSANTPPAIPVGEIEITAEISATLAEFFAQLPASEFASTLQADLAADYREGRGFATAFGCTMARLFAAYGVIVLDPQDIALKALTQNIYHQVLTNAASLAQEIVAHSQSLSAAGYQPQVYTSADIVPIFLREQGQRTAMVQQGSEFLLKNSAKRYSLAELQDRLATNPADFSPSVLLRPVIQDTLLPTVAYIGGPAEVAYFAQLKPIYATLQRCQPIAIARASLTVMPERESNLLKKYQLEFTDLFTGRDNLLRRIVESSLDQTTTTLFNETEAIFQTQLAQLHTALTGVDVTLADALKGSQEKILYQLQSLRTKFINSSAKREQTVTRQIERLITLLYPENTLQERQLNGYYFLARYGYGFIETLYQAIELDSDKHQVITL